MQDRAIRSSKLKGILKIEICGLPHPDWKFADVSSNVDNLLKGKTKHGWTIRSCSATEGLEIKLPFANNVPKKKVKKVISRFAKKLPSGAIFVIYPSWVFKKSGTCYFTASHIIIEAIAGPIAYLTDGKITPRLHLVLDRLNYGIKETTGEKDFLIPEELRALRHNCKKISEDNLVLEWAITSEDRLYYFHWIEI